MATILMLLASVIIPASASGRIAAPSEGSVTSIVLQAPIKLQEGCALAEYDSASGSLLAARGATHLADDAVDATRSGRRVFVGDARGNNIPVEPGQYVTGSPDGKWVQVRGPDGTPTGLRLDGLHSPVTHPDPRAQVPHAHVPGVTNPDGTPWLPAY